MKRKLTNFGVNCIVINMSLVKLEFCYRSLDSLDYSVVMYASNYAHVWKYVSNYYSYVRPWDCWESWIEDISMAWSKTNYKGKRKRFFI